MQADQFEATRKEQVKAMEEEYHRRFWEKKFDVYLRLCRAASSLALAQPESDEYKQANHDMMLIYGGELQVMASPEVKAAFRAFLSAVSLRKTKQIVKKDLMGFAPDLHRSLAALALACRQEAASEFQLSGEQVQKFDETTLDIDKIMREMESKIEAGK